MASIDHRRQFFLLQLMVVRWMVCGIAATTTTATTAAVVLAVRRLAQAQFGICMQHRKCFGVFAMNVDAKSARRHRRRAAQHIRDVRFGRIDGALVVATVIVVVVMMVVVVMR